MSGVLKSFKDQFVAVVKGDDAGALAAKVWRMRNSSIKMHIAKLDGDVIKAEVAVETAQERLYNARLNGGKMINDEDDYISSLTGAKNGVINAEFELKEYKEQLAFLNEELTVLSE